MDDNLKSECFISDKTRENLGKVYGEDGFSDHINEQHNMWDYMFIVAYLKFKKQSNQKNYTDISRYVITKIDENGHTWIPCHQ